MENCSEQWMMPLFRKRVPCCRTLGTRRRPPPSPSLSQAPPLRFPMDSEGFPKRVGQTRSRVTKPPGSLVLRE
jgi:hypothetical protein